MEQAPGFQVDVICAVYQTGTLSALRKVWPSTYSEIEQLWRSPKFIDVLARNLPGPQFYPKNSYSVFFLLSRNVVAHTIFGHESPSDLAVTRWEAVWEWLCQSDPTKNDYEKMGDLIWSCCHRAHWGEQCSEKAVTYLLEKYLQVQSIVLSDEFQAMVDRLVYLMVDFSEDVGIARRADHLWMYRYLIGQFEDGYFVPGAFLTDARRMNTLLLKMLGLPRYSSDQILAAIHASSHLYDHSILLIEDASLLRRVLVTEVPLEIFPSESDCFSNGWCHVQGIQIVHQGTPFYFYLSNRLMIDLEGQVARDREDWPQDDSEGRVCYAIRYGREFARFAQVYLPAIIPNFFQSLQGTQTRAKSARSCVSFE